ncbi:hypothetical protein M0Q50_01300 [bacterium]|jgi:hypothetical protein|nr:hypothetical protein [bacterium]
MKKLTFLFAIVIAVLTFTSCEPEIVNPETTKTEAFNIYEYVMVDTARLEIGMDTVVNDTTYTYTEFVVNTNGVGYTFQEYVNGENIGAIAIGIDNEFVTVNYMDIEQYSIVVITYNKTTGKEYSRTIDGVEIFTK